MSRIRQITVEEATGFLKKQFDAAGRAGAGRAAASSGSGSLVAALAVAFLLVAVSSGLLYLAHKASWEDAVERSERRLSAGPRPEGTIAYSPGFQPRVATGGCGL